jgi:hypothetical protein
MTSLQSFWHKSLSIQLLAAMLAALFVSQFIGLYIAWDKFRSDLHTSARTSRTTRASRRSGRPICPSRWP